MKDHLIVYIENAFHFYILLFIMIDEVTAENDLYSFFLNIQDFRRGALGLKHQGSYLLQQQE